MLQPPALTPYTINPLPTMTPSPPLAIHAFPSLSGRWELLGVGAEGLGAAAAELRSRTGRKKQDRELADKVGARPGFATAQP